MRNYIKLDIVHCNCPAGESQSCVHLSALLHALECLFEAPRKAILVGTAVGESKTSLECMYVGEAKKVQSSSHLCQYPPLCQTRIQEKTQETQY